MALFSFNSRRGMSVLLVYATQCTANCVAFAILIGTYQLVRTCQNKQQVLPPLPTEVMPAFVYCSVTQLQDRAPLQAQSAI